MTNLMNRRAALGSIAAGVILAAPAIALAVQSDLLAELIAAHQKARDQFGRAIDEL
jgi:sensor histidine kinase regulating citrate/malate metabolism